MKESFEQDFHIPVQWVEDQSRNTTENAQFSATILKQKAFRLYLVTHACISPRARAAFEKMGMTVSQPPWVCRPEESLVLDFCPRFFSRGKYKCTA
jgi:uncharacterized SAM-binding protein YcdF (DUF218 family)